MSTQADSNSYIVLQSNLTTLTSTLRSILDRVTLLAGNVDVINVRTEKHAVFGHTGFVDLGCDGEVTSTISGCVECDPKHAECKAMFNAIASIIQGTSFCIKDFSFHVLRFIEECTASMRREVCVLNSAAKLIEEIMSRALSDVNAIMPSGAFDDEGGKLIEYITQHTKDFMDYASKCSAELQANKDMCYS